jgi:hypothetical protein
MKLSDLVGTGGMAMVQSRLIYSSTTINVQNDGIAIIAGIGGGAGGVKSYAPGNSAPWGVKALAVAAGDQLGIAIGMGGAPVTFNAAALPGGATVIYHKGAAVMTCQGGDGGTASEGGAAVTNAQVVGADFWMAGRQPQLIEGGRIYAGAAVDLGNGTFSPSTDRGDCGVEVSAGPAGIGLPKGSYFWPFDVLITAVDGSPGVGATAAPTPSAGNAGLFGGGGTSFNASWVNAPGRGASAGRDTQSGRTPHYGGAGLVHLRLFKRI